jgi:hypothetical protein
VVIDVRWEQAPHQLQVRYIGWSGVFDEVRLALLAFVLALLFALFVLRGRCGGCCCSFCHHRCSRRCSSRRRRRWSVPPLPPLPQTPSLCPALTL